MIKCEKFSGQPIFINADLIEFVEATPDTIITTTTGKKIFVKDSVEEVVDKVVKYKKRIYEGLNIKLTGNLQ